jgi:hypothetical protein
MCGCGGDVRFSTYPFCDGRNDLNAARISLQKI